MQWTVAITLIVLVVYAWMMVNVGIARGKYKILAPQTEGPVEFLRVLRVQINTTEQLVLFLPSLWMCAYTLGDHWAALGGMAWVIGRIVYALAYYRDASKRQLGFGITLFSSATLMIGVVIGLIIH